MLKLNSILLVDDDDATNFMNKRTLRKLNCAEKIIVRGNGKEALDYLTTPIESVGNKPQYPQPELIFLDINMPVMSGWEFLEHYEKLPLNQQSKVVVVMLTTSLKVEDQQKAKDKKLLNGFMSKPLTKVNVEKIIKENFTESL